MNLLLSIKGQYSNSGISLTKIKYFFQSTNYFIRITQLSQVERSGGGWEFGSLEGWKVGRLEGWEFGSLGV